MCFALSCKKFFGLFGAIAKHRHLRFPRQPEYQPRSDDENSLEISRTALLLRLENKRWAYCARCLKLHRRRDFSIPIKKYAPLRRSCVDHAGIVDLCGCVSLTIGDRARLIKVLQSKAQLAGGPFWIQTDQAGKVSLQHHCSTDKRASPGCKTDIYVSLQIEGDNELTARTRYVTTLRPGPKSVLYPRIYSCAHARLSFLPFRELGLDDCPLCDTRFERQLVNDEPVIIDAKRNLGSCDQLADSHWFRQCRESADRDATYWEDTCIPSRRLALRKKKRAEQWQRYLDLDWIGVTDSSDSFWSGQLLWNSSTSWDPICAMHTSHC